MTKIKLGILSIGIVFVLIACTDNAPQHTTSNTTSNTNTSQTNTQPTPQPTPADMMAEARTLYADNCADCHKPNGEGGTVTLGKEKLNAPSLKKGHILKDSDEKLIKIITEGEEDMPPFKDQLSEEQIKALVQFIRKEFQSGAQK